LIATGVDLSAEHTKTWMATIEVTRSGANLVGLGAQVSNAEIVRAASESEKVGIDCPFGWPVPFVAFVTEHMHGIVAPQSGVPIDWRRGLAYRETDRFVTAQTGLRPLSVAADRIAHAAMRCADLLAELTRAGIPVDRSGVDGRVVEVYPSASLFRWGLTHRGYKRNSNAERLDEVVTALVTRAPWLSLGAFESECRHNDDAFDSVIAALSAAACAAGLTSPPAAGRIRELARQEGWIALPSADSLDRLC
jgi:hypothetical protein